MYERVIIKIKKELLEKSREILLSQVGLKELTNNNDGEHIKGYMKSVGLAYGKGYPYCAAGQYYCFFVANNSTRKGIPILASGSANGIFDNARKNGIIETYEHIKDIPLFDNDLLVWIKPKTYQGHIERIIETSGSLTCLTVGFNTSSGELGNQRDGGGVYKRQRALNKNLGKNVFRGVIHFEVE